MKRVMILTLSFGAGHVRAAEAIAREIKTTRTDIEPIVLDALEGCRWLFRAVYVWPYLAMIRFAPWLWERFFESRRERSAANTAPKWLWRWGCGHVIEETAKCRPDLILACEVGAVELAEIIRGDGACDAPVMAVITDLDAEPIWAKDVVTSYAVANEHVRDQLVRWGKEAAPVNVCGIPVDGSFAGDHDPDSVREQFGLDNRPVILLMGGGTGPTRMSEVAGALLESTDEIQIVALPAKDKTALARLAKLDDHDSHGSLHIVPWTDKVAALMNLAQVLVTKPGGVTTSEAAAARLPMVFFDAIPGPENENARYFVAKGAAVEAADARDAAAIALRLIADPDALQMMSSACDSMAKRGATAAIVEVIAEMLMTTHLRAPGSKPQNAG